MLWTRREFVAGSLTVAASSVMKGVTPVGDPTSYGATPTPLQRCWQQMETYAFVHFGVNTFTDKEWGYGDESPDLFNPANFDPDQIVESIKMGGLKGLILTAKHHDGFCLWPTRTTEHSVRNSKWMAGKGDVVRAISDAARRHSVKFGIYVSPWDRNAATYGTPTYLQMYREQIRELMTGYGPIFLVWFDGANGGDGYYGGARETRKIDQSTYYEWSETQAIVRNYQPSAIIHGQTVLGDMRWVGNEKGYAAETCWETFTPKEANGRPLAPGGIKGSDLKTGERHGSKWLPPECDVSIRPGWFWHASEDASVKSSGELFDLYTKSVGRGGLLLLNVPPNRDGVICEQDRKSLVGFHRLVERTFAHNLLEHAHLIASNVRDRQARFSASHLLEAGEKTFWATDDTVTSPTLEVRFSQAVEFDIFRLKEATQFGQRIDAVVIDVWDGSGFREIAQATSIGICRIVRLNSPVQASGVRIRIQSSSASVVLAEAGLYRTPVPAK